MASQQGSSLRSLAEARRQLEDRLEPWKPMVLAVYVNCLLGYKPTYAAVFYVSYFGVLWYVTVTTKTILTLVSMGAASLFLAQLGVETMNWRIELPADFYQLDPSHAQETAMHKRSMPFPEICTLLVKAQTFATDAVAYVNKLRLQRPNTYFGLLIAVIVASLALSVNVTDDAIVFWSGALLVLLPAIEHYRSVQIVESHITSAWPAYPGVKQETLQKASGVVQFIVRLVSKLFDVSDVPVPATVATAAASSSQGSASRSASAITSPTATTTTSSTSTSEQLSRSSSPDSAAEVAESFYLVNRDVDLGSS